MMGIQLHNVGSPQAPNRGVYTFAVHEYLLLIFKRLLQVPARLADHIDSEIQNIADGVLNTHSLFVYLSLLAQYQLDSG